MNKPTSPRPTPPVELLITGTIAPKPAMLVRYTDEDASGELRLIEQEPQRPARVA